jgi:hypothetical protein
VSGASAALVLRGPCLNRLRDGGDETAFRLFRDDLAVLPKINGSAVHASWSVICFPNRRKSVPGGSGRNSCFARFGKQTERSALVRVTNMTGVIVDGAVERAPQTNQGFSATTLPFFQK